MADADDVRRVALSLEGVQEIESDGFDFRAGGKGFVWVDAERLVELVTDAWAMRTTPAS